MTCSRLVILAAVCALFCPALALAQEDDPDRDLQLSQPDFTIVNLPTTLRVPRHKGVFRLTHRFARPQQRDCPHRQTLNQKGERARTQRYWSAHLV